MKRMRDRWTPEQEARLIRTAAVSVIGVFIVSGLGLGVLAAVASSQANSDEAKAKVLSGNAAQIRQVIGEVQNRASVKVQDQSKAVAAFQQNMGAIAQENNCRLSDFTASTDFQPFVTRFSKQPDPKGWSQIEIQVNLAGPARQVVDVIAKLSEQSVPIEFNSITLTRESVAAAGSRVKAKIQLRVLIPERGVSA